MVTLASSPFGPGSETKQSRGSMQWGRASFLTTIKALSSESATGLKGKVLMQTACQPWHAPDAPVSIRCPLHSPSWLSHMFDCDPIMTHMCTSRHATLRVLPEADCKVPYCTGGCAANIAHESHGKVEDSHSRSFVQEQSKAQSCNVGCSAVMIHWNGGGLLVAFPNAPPANEAHTHGNAEFGEYNILPGVEGGGHQVKVAWPASQAV